MLAVGNWIRRMNMPIRIALCDDEEACRETIANLLKEYRQAASLPSFALSHFASGKELLSFIDDTNSKCFRRFMALSIHREKLLLVTGFKR